MATITEVRDALAEALRSALELSRGLGRTPSPILPSTAFVIPQPGSDYLSYENGTFCRPQISLSAIVVGPTNNIAKAYEWLDVAIAKAPDALSADPTLGGRASHIVLDTVGEPGLLDAQSDGGFKPFLSVELRFKPFFVKT